MIINLKTAKMLSITVKRHPLVGRTGIEQLTKYDCPDIRFLARTGPPAMSAVRSLTGVNRT
jgi:hypothetical protein